MKKALKIFGVVMVAILVMLALTSTALHVLLPPEKAKALVLKQLTAHLKREVRTGDVSVGVLSGLDVSKLEVSEAPDFSQGTFISSDHFSIRLALLPLLFRKVEVKQLVLEHPVIRVVRETDGKTYNFSDLTAPSTGTVQKADTPDTGLFEIPSAYADAAPPAVSSPDDVPPFAFVISNAQIQNGVVHFIDRSPAKQSVDIDPLNLKLKNVSLTSPFAVQAFLKAKSKDVMATLKLAGEADLATGSFKIKHCELSSGGSSVNLSGKAEQLKSKQPSVDLKLDIKEFKMSTLAPLMILPAGLKLEGPILGQAEIKGDQKKMDLAGMLELDKVHVAYAKQFFKPPDVPLRVTLQAQLKELRDLEIPDLKAILGSLHINAHGSVIGVNSGQPQISLHLESNTFPVMELAGYAPSARPKDLVLKGKAQFAADVSGTQTSSQLAAKCDAKELGIVFGDKFVKSEGVPMRFSVVGERIQSAGKKPEEKWNFQGINLVLASLELNGKGSMVTPAAGQSRLQMAFKSNTFALQDVAKLSPMADAYKPRGSAILEMRVSGTASTPIANGSLTLRDAAIRYENSELTQLSSTIGFTQQDVSIPKLTGKLNGSDLSLSLTGHRLTTHPDLTVNATIAELDLGKLLPSQQVSLRAERSNPLGQFSRLLRRLAPRNDGFAWAAAPPAAVPPMDITGQLNVGRIKHAFYNAQNLDFRWDLKNVTPDLAQITGKADLKQGPGKLEELEKLVALSNSARIALLPITTLQKLDKSGLLKNIGLPSLNTIPFNGIKGDYALRSGMMDIKAFDLTGEDLSVNTLGTIGLAGTQPLDVRVVMRLRPGLVRGTIGQLMSDETGRLTLAFDAKGTVSNPSVKLDVRQSTQKAVQRLGDQLFKSLGRGRQPEQEPTPPPPNTPAPNATAPSPQTETPQAPPPPPPDPGKELQKVFKNIFKK